MLSYSVFGFCYLLLFTQTILRDYSPSAVGTTTLVRFRPVQLSRKVLQIAVASGTSNLHLGGEPVI
jgi:hypothetical protein